jgi:hypothetical protein
LHQLPHLFEVFDAFIELSIERTPAVGEPLAAYTNLKLAKGLMLQFSLLKSAHPFAPLRFEEILPQWSTLSKL